MGWEAQLNPVRTLAERAGTTLDLIDVGRDQAGYNAALESIKRTGAEALLVPSPPVFSRDRRIIIDLVARHRIRAMFDSLP